MTVADEQWFRETFPQAHTATMPAPIRIKSIASDAHLSNLYSVVTIFVPGRRQDEPVLLEVEVEVHLVQGLKCHMLIGVDMLKPYGMSLDFESSTLRIPSCNVSTPIRTKSVEKQQAQRRKVKVRERTIVLPYSRRAIPIKFQPFAEDSDVNFRPIHNQSTAYLALSRAFLESVCSNSTAAVYYHNKTDRPVVFSRSLPIGELAEFGAYTEAFWVDTERGWGIRTVPPSVIRLSFPFRRQQWGCTCPPKLTLGSETACREPLKSNYLRPWENLYLMTSDLRLSVLP